MPERSSASPTTPACAYATLPRRWASPSAPLITEVSLLAKEGRLQIYSIPFERLTAQRGSRSSGWRRGSQTKQAFTAARDAFRGDMTDALLVLDYIERQAGFAWSMRTNNGQDARCHRAACCARCADQRGALPATRQTDPPVRSGTGEGSRWSISRARYRPRLSGLDG
jgi:hypothetical protein